MTRSFLKPALAGLIAATLLGTAVTLPAEDQKPVPVPPKAEAVAPKPEAPAPPHMAHKGLPYGGTVSAVDKTAKTVSVKQKEASKTFLVTSSTKIMKAGKPATLDEAVVGEAAGVFFKENTEGKLEALSLRLGDKPEKPGGEMKKKTEEKKQEAGAVEEKKVRH